MPHKNNILLIPSDLWQEYQSKLLLVLRSNKDNELWYYSDRYPELRVVEVSKSYYTKPTLVKVVEDSLNELLN